MTQLVFLSIGHDNTLHEDVTLVVHSSPHGQTHLADLSLLNFLALNVFRAVIGA
jgi:hypothetical protein